MPELTKILPLLVPVLLLQLGLQIAALVSLIKRDKVRFNNKFIWGAIIFIGGIIGPIIYFAVGKDGGE